MNDPYDFRRSTGMQLRDEGVIYHDLAHANQMKDGSIVQEKH